MSTFETEESRRQALPDMTVKDLLRVLQDAVKAGYGDCCPIVQLEPHSTYMHSKDRSPHIGGLKEAKPVLEGRQFGLLAVTNRNPNWKKK